MLATIEVLCAECNNYHDYDRKYGTYTIENGIITLPFLAENQFFRIVGSKFNDGVYIYVKDGIVCRASTWEEAIDADYNWLDLRQQYWGDIAGHDLIDETFTGSIWAMNMPRAFFDLSKEIAAYNATDAAKTTPYTSENISGYYSYSKASADSNIWFNVFAHKLKRWKKVPNI